MSGLSLCHCRLPGISTSSSTEICQAGDSVDDQVFACDRNVFSQKLMRSSVRTNFFALCLPHYNALCSHFCCPVCGIFCSQGDFLRCGQDVFHIYHKQCEIKTSGVSPCPHCGNKSCSIPTKLGISAPLPMDVEHQNTNRPGKESPARITYTSFETSQPQQLTKTCPKFRSLSTEGLPTTPFTSLVVETLTTLANRGEDILKEKTDISIHEAIEQSNWEALLIHTADGRDVNSKQGNETCLHTAVRTDNILAVCLLLQAGANIDEVNGEGVTPLILAVKLNKPDILQLLTEGGANVSSPSDSGMQAIHTAAAENHTKCLEILLHAGAQVNALDDLGWTPLLWAIDGQHVEACQLLLSSQADCMHIDLEGNTCLHWACFAGFEGLVRFLVDTVRIDTDAKNRHGETALHMAAKGRYLEIINYLLCHFASVEPVNKNGQRAVDCLPSSSDSTPCRNLLEIAQVIQKDRDLKQLRRRRLIHRDITRGRERMPIACYNAVDDEPAPMDNYVYVNTYVQTEAQNIRQLVTSLGNCLCDEDCASVNCNCCSNSGGSWYAENGRLVEGFNYRDPPILFECNMICRCFSSCRNRVIQHGIRVKLELFKTSSRGWGVYSTRLIPKGTFVCEYIGEYISDLQADRRGDDSYLFDLDCKSQQAFCVDARLYGNIARFINHSCDANLTSVQVHVEHQDLRFPRISFFTNRDVPAGVELGVDYGEKFWLVKSKHFTCTCGSYNCRFSAETIQDTLRNIEARHLCDSERPVD